MASNYTDHALYRGARVTETPRSNQGASGYGSRVPTRYLINYANRERRVYMMQYGNAGSPYVIVGGQIQFLDTDTEHALAAAGQRQDEKNLP